MLASIIVFGLSEGTFDIPQLRTAGGSTWLFLGFVAAFAVKAPLFPFHGWLPAAYREAPAEVAGVLSGVVSKAAAYGFLYIAIVLFPGPAADLRVPILALAAIGLVYGSLLAFRAPRHPRRDRVLEPRAARADHARPLRDEPRRLERRPASDGEPRAALGDAVHARRHRRMAHGHRPLRPARRHGPWSAGAGHGADDRPASSRSPSPARPPSPGSS